MHHLATLSEGPFPGKPHRVQCACGSSGDFSDETQAQQWFNIHTSRIGPTETSALVVPSAADSLPAPSGTSGPPPAPPAPVPFRADNQQPKEETAT